MSQNVERMPETIGGLDYRQYDAVHGSAALGEAIRAIMPKPRIRVSVSLATGKCWCPGKPTLSPFERQDIALANGAGLVANVRVGR